MLPDADSAVLYTESLNLYPGADSVGRDRTYLSDTAKKFALLMDREAEPFARYHFRGDWDAGGTEMIAAIRKAVGNDSIPVKGMARFILKLVSSFNKPLRELVATHLLWQTPIQLDNTQLVRFLGEEPNTLFLGRATITAMVVVLASLIAEVDGPKREGTALS